MLRLRPGAMMTAATTVQRTQAWRIVDVYQSFFERAIVSVGSINFSSQSRRSVILKDGTKTNTDGQSSTTTPNVVTADAPVNNKKDITQARHQQSSHDTTDRLSRDERWNYYSEKLATFVAEHGHTMVPPSYDSKLHSWVERQKNIYRKRHMMRQHPGNSKPESIDYRMDRLNQLGMTWESLDDRWEVRFDELNDFYQQHGHTHFPMSANPTLYHWSVFQRRQYKRLQDNSTSTLTDERIEKLNRIGFVWAPYENKWMERFTALVRYKANHGDCLVPWAFNQDPELARWVVAQREKYMKRRRMEKRGEEIPEEDDTDIISPRRIAMLNEIGFVWKPFDLKWNSKYETLRAYVEQNGFGHLPSKRTSQPLHQWMKRQQRYYQQRLQGKTTTLTDDRIRKLDMIGFDWNDKL